MVWASALGSRMPVTVGARQRAFHALPVIPAVEGNFPIGGGHAGDVGVGGAAQALGHTGEHARPARGGGRHHDGGLGGLAQGFGRRRVRGIARLGKLGAAHRQIAGGRAGGDGIGGRLGIFSDQTDDELRARQGAMQRGGRVQSFTSRGGKGAAGFGMGENKDGFHKLIS